MKTIRELIPEIAGKLASIPLPKVEAEQEAWWLVEHITGINQASILTQDLTLSHEQHAILYKMLNDRVQRHKPLQYIIGSVPFCDLTIATRPPILIPRPETEELTAWLIEKIKKVYPKGEGLKILDIGAGSGCIALALARHLPRATVVGCDINPEARDLARENAEKNNIRNVTFVISDIFSSFEGRTFDLIVSNPPYIDPEDRPDLQEDVKEWEDSKALFAPHHGLAIIEQIAKLAPHHLSSKLSGKLPQLVLEFGETQAPDVKNLLIADDWQNIQIHKDLEGKNRWVSASR